MHRQAQAGLLTGQTAEYMQGTPLALILITFNFTAILSIALAILLFLKRRDEGVALFLSYFLLIFGLQSGPIESLEPFLPGIGMFQQSGPAVGTLTALAVLLLALFPDGKFKPTWTRWVVIVGIAALIPVSLVDWLQTGNMLQTETGSLILVGLSLVLASALVVGQIQRYRYLSGQVERQQLKWFIYGFGLQLASNIVAGLPWAYLSSLPPGTPDPWWSLPASILWTLGNALVPIALTVALLRYRLYDIDIIIRRTLQYAVVTGVLALVYFGGVVQLQAILRSLTGQESPLAVVISTLAIAALFSPLRVRVQNLIDRRFYRRRYNRQQLLSDFATAARDEVELDRLTASLLEVARDSMEPERVALWLVRGRRAT